MISTCIYKTIITCVLTLPLPALQHYVWPLSWCILADQCNHTFFTSCGYDDLENRTKEFMDICDMYEFNCDAEKDYYWVPRSRCMVRMNLGDCPDAPKCPKQKKCRKGRGKGKGGEQNPEDTEPEYPEGPRPRPDNPQGPGPDYPQGPGPDYPQGPKPVPRANPEEVSIRNVLRAHRYRTRRLPKPTPRRPNRRTKFTKYRSLMYRRFAQTTPLLQTVVLKKETILRFGRPIMRVIKGYALKKRVPKNIDQLIYGKK